VRRAKNKQLVRVLAQTSGCGEVGTQSGAGRAGCRRVSEMIGMRAGR